MLRISKPCCVAASLLFSLSAFGCHRKAKQTLGSDPEEKESYSLGYQVGARLKTQKTSINVDAYIAGLREGMTGAKPQVSEEEQRTSVANLRNRAMAGQRAGLKEQSDKNRTAGQTFLDQNRSKEGVQVLPSGLQYKVLKEGFGRSPRLNDTVIVNYRGTLVDGTEFADSYKQKKAVRISLGKVIPAWKESLPLMKEGARWQLFVPPELGYGARGSTGIGPNSTLLFDVELLSVAIHGAPEQASAAPTR